MSKLKKDILRTYNMGNYSKKRRILNCLIAPGVRAMVVYRFGKWIDKKGKLTKIVLLPLYYLLNQRLKSKWGIEISKGAEIGEGFYIGHFGGITISPLAKIGKNVNISQQVTIGESGQGERRGAPTIGDDVYIGAGAKLIGKITIGNNAKIGANAVIHKDIPENAVVVMSPGFEIISYKGNRKKE